jgi:hypothetical protein
MLGRRKNHTSDVSRIAASALEAFLEGEKQSQNGHEPARKRGGRRLGTAGALAVGAAAVAGGRAVYKRAKQVDLIDLTEVAARAEDRLKP